MQNAQLYKPSDPRVIRDTEALPRWERDLVTAQTQKVAVMLQGDRSEQEFLQRAFARVDRRKQRRN